MTEPELGDLQRAWKRFDALGWKCGIALGYCDPVTEEWSALPTFEEMVDELIKRATGGGQPVEDDPALTVSTCGLPMRYVKTVAPKMAWYACDVHSQASASVREGSPVPHCNWMIQQ